MLYATTTSDVVVVLQYVTPYICTGACMYSITLHGHWLSSTFIQNLLPVSYFSEDIF